MAIFALCSLFASVSMALPTEYYAQQSALANGHWVKIRVDKEGIYQISYDQLRQWGFSDPSKVGIYGYGGVSLAGQRHTTLNPDDLTRSYAHHDSALEKMFFYGEGALRSMATSISTYNYQRNYYSDYGYYFLSDCNALQTPIALECLTSRSNRRFTTSLHCVSIENEVQNPVGIGLYFHDKAITSGEDYAYTLDIINYDPSEFIDNIHLSYNFAAQGPQNTVLQVGAPDGFIVGNIDEGLAAPIVSDTRKYNLAQGFYNWQSPDGTLSDGNYTFTLGLIASANQYYCAVDKVHFIYPRRNRLPDDGAPYMIEHPTADDMTDFVIENATASTIVLNCTDPSFVCLQQTNFIEESKTLEGNYNYRNYIAERPMRLIAFDPRTTKVLPEPEYVGEVSQQNIHGAKTPAMLIVCSEPLRSAAMELAEIHRARGLECLVVTQDEVFNEFSSGTPSAFAINRCAKMFYDRDPQKFKYVLIYGSGNWDTRALVRTKNDNYVITHECELPTYGADTNTAYCHDGFFGMISDNFNPANIMFTHHNVAVGRIPASDIAVARSVNAKIKKYLDNPPTIDNYVNALMSSDDGNMHTHIKHSICAMDTMSILRPAMTYTQAHNLIYPWTGTEALAARAVVRKALQRGVGFFAYSGHGSARMITNEQLWNRSAIASTSYDLPPFTLLVTCDSYRYDETTSDFTQDLLTKVDGGAIGIIAGSRSVFMELNQGLNSSMAGAYASAPAGSTIGDVYRAGHNDYMDNFATTQSYGVNTLCFNLCGDPSLPIAAPSHNIRFERLNTINISQITPGDPNYTQAISDIVALKPTKLSGHIIDAEGNIATDFNGSVNITVYESPRTVKTILQNPDDARYDTPTDISIEEEVLTTVSTTVNEGYFESTFTCPAPSLIGKFNRIVVTATSDDKSMSAASVYDRSHVVDPRNPLDYPAPSIDRIRVESFGALPGLVDADATLCAIISTSEIGLNLSDAMGKAPTIRLDSKNIPSAKNYFKAIADNSGKYELSMPLSGLSDGYHSAYIRVADNAGKTAEASISFYVSTSQATAKLKIAEAINPTDRSTITFELDNPGEISSVGRLLINDALGNTVFTVANPVFPYTWDLNATDGTPLADGHYSAYVILSDGKRHAATAPLPLPLIR